MKGNIDLEKLKDRFRTDLINNMKLAERMGVLQVIRNLEWDAQRKIEVREQQRATQAAPSQPTPAPKPAETEFPGYEERVDEVYREAMEQKVNILRHRRDTSNEVLGGRAAFTFNESSQVSLPSIFSNYHRDETRAFQQELFT